MATSMAQQKKHPSEPQSNVPILEGFDPNNYAIDGVSPTILTHEDLTPNRPPCLTQFTVGKFLQPLTRELVAVPPRPTIDELPEAVKDQMILKDKAYWVDKPGANAYTLHDAHHNYGMSATIVTQNPQAVFPRSYQYDLDCVHYRRLHACDGLNQKEGEKKKAVSAHCRNCRKINVPGLTPFQLAWVKDPGLKRWRDYPDVSAMLSPAEMKVRMGEVGRPFRSEACNWYYENYPAVKYDCIVRKFSK